MLFFLNCTTTFWNQEIAGAPQLSLKKKEKFLGFLFVKRRLKMLSEIILKGLETRWQKRRIQHLLFFLNRMIFKPISWFFSGQTHGVWALGVGNTAIPTHFGVSNAAGGAEWRSMACVKQEVRLMNILFPSDLKDVWNVTPLGLVISRYNFASINKWPN